MLHARHNLIAAYISLAAAATWAGCSKSMIGEAPTSMAAAAEPIAPTAPSPNLKPTPAAASIAANLSAPSPRNASTLAAKKESEAATDAEPDPPYEPPFPERVDLFVAPKREGGNRVVQDGNQDAIELLGFVRVDRQQVVLSINGLVTPIAEGGSQNGVEVISIQPPTVVLQRGRQRWQATLDN